MLDIGWRSEVEMPATFVETEILKDVVWSACRAPSLHNIQPWQWVLAGHGQLQLFLDRSRVLSSDRSGREAVIGCGAALDHLGVAAAAAGWQSGVERFPNPDDPTHLASIHFTPMDHVTDEQRRRARAIWARRSNRLPFAPPTNWASFEPALHNRLDNKAVRLDILPDDALPRLAEASQVAESLRLYDSGYHAELGRWTTPFTSSEGIPYSCLTPAAEASGVSIGRTFPVPHHIERRVDIPEDHATILVLSTRTDSPADALATGEMLSAVLLECTMAGLATCPLTHLTEMQVTREIVETLLGHDGVAQILVRVGMPVTTNEVAPFTARRRLEDVLRVEG